MLGVTNAINMRTKLNIDEYTLLLITDSIEDKSGHNVPITNSGGVISTTRQRDGRNSIQLNGNTGLMVNNLECQLTTLFGGNNDWTIEFYGFVTSFVSTGALVEMNNRNGNAYANVLFMYSNSANKLFYSSSNGGSWNVYNAPGVCTGVVNEWAHYVICRSYPVIRVFQNGIQTWSNTLNGAFPTPSSGNTWFGCRGTDDAGTGHSLNIQDIRISNCARYTANFTPPERFI